MKKKKDALLQQITENHRESTVFFLTGYAAEHQIGLKLQEAMVALHIETGSGFFVAPDKIVTTIDLLADTTGVTAIPADSFAKISNNRGLRSFRRRNRSQVSEEETYTIEGVTAYDTKNNLVLLKIAETGVPLPFSDSDTVEIGETVYALGYEDDTKFTATAGYLQSRYKDDKWLQMKIQFFPGSNGGPVLNSKQEVIGVLAYSTGSAVSDSRSMMATVISSNVLKELLTSSGKVMPLEQFQNHSRVRAYALEAQADEKKEERYDDRGTIRDYNAALKLNTDLVEIYSKRGIVKLRIANFEGACKDFDKMIRINPGHIFAYNNRASARGNLGDEQGALDDLNKAIEINPEYAIAYFNLAEINGHIAENKVEEQDIIEAKRYCQEAIDNYTKGFALNPKNPLARKYRRNAKRILRLLKVLSETE